MSMDEVWKKMVSQVEDYIAHTNARLDKPTDPAHRKQLIASLVFNTNRLERLHEIKREMTEFKQNHLTDLFVEID